MTDVTQSLEQPAEQHFSVPGQSPSRSHAAEHSSNLTGIEFGHSPGRFLMESVKKIQDFLQPSKFFESLHVVSKQVVLSNEKSRHGNKH